MESIFRVVVHLRLSGFWLLPLFLAAREPLRAADPRPPSGIPEIDSLPLHDWNVNNPPLSAAKALALSALLPGGGQFYGHHPVRGGFLLGLESILIGLSLSTYLRDIPHWDRDVSRLLDSADAAVARMGDPGQLDQAKADFARWNRLARERAGLRQRQADLANSELAWAVGLHFYGLTDALEIVRQSHESDDSPAKSVRRAMWTGLAFPGGGQLYNARYGKFGLLWMGLSGAALSAWSRQNMVESLNRQVATAAAEQRQGLTTNLEELQRDRTLYRKRRNQYYWGMAVFYIYSVLDGMVDAALSDFDTPSRYALGPGFEPLSAALTISF